MTPSPSSLVARSVILVVIALSVACAAKMRSTATAPLTDEQIAQLWQEPADLTARDLQWGPGGREKAPTTSVVYKVVGLDTRGNSVGYDVEDPTGTSWRIKVGEEVQCEVVASRLLWAIGYHQPALYFLKDWKRDGGNPDHQGLSARFRLEEGYDAEGVWSWQQNPYVGTRPFKGLIVANLILNNWDLKNSNNRVYQVSDAMANGAPRTWFVVQDLGAALGRTKWPTGNRNDVAGFERRNLIKRVENGIVKFDYSARHTELFKDITPADVLWTARLLARLTDEQWRDAFRAAAYPEVDANRFIAKLKSKVKEGLALEPLAGNNP